MDGRSVAPPGPTPTLPRELTGILDLTRGEHHPTGRLIGPDPRKVWHRVQDLARRVQRRLPRGGANRDARILPRTARTPTLGLLQDATSVLDAFHIVKLAGDSPGEVRRRVQQDTLGHRGRKGDHLYLVHNLLRASCHRLTPRQKERLREAFVADEAHISVEVAYLHRASARGLPPSHTHPRPTPGRSSHPAPTSLSHPRNRPTRPDPTQMEGRPRGLLRHSRSQQRTPPKPAMHPTEASNAPHRSHQRTLSN